MILLHREKDNKCHNWRTKNLYAKDYVLLSCIEKVIIVVNRIIVYET